MQPLHLTWEQLVAGLQRRLGNRPRCPMCARHEMNLERERLTLTRVTVFQGARKEVEVPCVRLVCTICGNVQLFDEAILMAAAPPQ